jgi:hypothetical protein
MGNLICLSTANGEIRIMDKSAVKYRDIGAVLLNQDDVSNIEMMARGNPVEAVRMVYQEWMRKDERRSWEKLTKCFRKVTLSALAGDIERHFGLPSPPAQGEPARVSQEDQPSPPEQNGGGDTKVPQREISPDFPSTLTRRTRQEEPPQPQPAASSITWSSSTADYSHRASGSEGPQKEKSCDWQCFVWAIMILSLFCLIFCIVLTIL